jgi:hypothetical protein
VVEDGKAGWNRGGDAERADLRLRTCRNHSARNVCVRSTVAARRANSNDAAKVSSSNDTAASVRASGSTPLTPKRNERSIPMHESSA